MLKDDSMIRTSNKPKAPKSDNLQLAFNEILGALFIERSDGRVAIDGLGNYTPFIVTENTKDWLRRAYELKPREAERAYRLLISRIRRYLEEKRYYEDAKDRRKRSNFLGRSDFEQWKADNFR